MKITGFPPIAPDRPRILILGSMPSNESLRQQQYYANPRNAFWKIMSHFLGFEASLDYEQRTKILKQHHIALWDVLKHCERQGSLDSAIKRDSEEANDLAGFLWDHDSIKAVLFNGIKSRNFFQPTYSAGIAPLACRRYPICEAALQQSGKCTTEIRAKIRNMASGACVETTPRGCPKTPCQSDSS